MQTPFAKYRGQLVQYCTQSVHSNPQMSGLISTTTATSCSLALQGWCCGHTTECVTITAVLALVILVSLTSVLSKRCLQTAIQSTDTLFPSLLYTLDKRDGSNVNMYMYDSSASFKSHDTKEPFILPPLLFKAGKLSGFALFRD